MESVGFGEGTYLPSDLRDKDFNRKLDHYLMTKQITVDDYETLTAIQKDFIQTLKRAFKRII